MLVEEQIKYTKLFLYSALPALSYSAQPTVSGHGVCCRLYGQWLRDMGELKNMLSQMIYSLCSSIVAVQLVVPHAVVYEPVVCIHLHRASVYLQAGWFHVRDSGTGNPQQRRISTIV